MALPLSAGALQETVRLVLLPETPATVGAVGAAGAVAVTVERLLTAGTPPEPVVKSGVSWPRASWKALASSPAVGSA